MAQKKDLIVSADFGTGSVKVGAVTPDLRVIAGSMRSYPADRPAPGHVEQDPERWWQELRAAIADLRKEIPDLNRRAACLVSSAQMNGLICADAEGRALRPCLIWLDKRASAAVQAFFGGFPAVLGYNVFKVLRWLYLTNGAPSLSGTDMAGKILWLRASEPGVWQRTHHLLDCKDWLLLKATGRCVTTPDSAHLSWLMDARPGRWAWSQSLLEALGVPREMMPEIVDGTARAGALGAEAAAALDLPEGLPVSAGCGDLFATAVGSGAVGYGALHLYLGTSSWIGGFFRSRRLDPFARLATVTGAVDRRPLLMASQETTGACVDWIARLLDTQDADGCGPPERFIDEALEETASTGLLFLPWLAGERVPFDDDRLRGAFLGLSLDDDRLSMMRAVLEGVALNTRWLFNAVRRQPGVDRRAPLRVVGGLAANRSFCRLLADCLNQPLLIMDEPRLAGVRGAARVAATTLGWIESPWVETPLESGGAGVLMTPDPARAAHYDRRFALFRSAHRRTTPWFHRAARAVAPPPQAVE